MPHFIRALGDRNTHSKKEIVEYCASECKLSVADRQAKLSNGNNLLLNRVGWAATYLKKAELIESPKRAHFFLTKRGIQAFKTGANCVTPEYLRQFESFRQFENKNTTYTYENTEQAESENHSPQEKIEHALEELTITLADDIKAEIFKMSPYSFESLVVKLLIKMGYGEFKQNEDGVTSKSNDEGIDGIVSSDKFGFDSIYIQAKLWKEDSKVGRPEIQKFIGALAGQGATKGLNNL